MFRRLFRREETRTAEEPAVAAPPCPHVALIPYWDSAEDMGKATRVSRFTCESCDAAFSREEGERLQAQETARIRLAEGERQESQRRPD
ncbi:MAG TPA: hypothetical protein VFT91_07395 [Dehalococcoidia bacterium]|nr:hypothetical protein [Dehalococcoidia bacterium]